jgi:hypothetical protein
MVLQISRRTVLSGLGCAAVAVFGPRTTLAGLMPAPDLEALFGRRRIEVVKEVWRAGIAGELAPAGPLDLGWGYVNLGELLDANDRFRVCRATRHGVTQFMSGCPAVEIEIDPDEDDTTRLVNSYTTGLAVLFGLFPPNTRADLVFGPGGLCKKRFWTGEVGNALGWRDFTNGKGYGRPRPELIRLV